VLERPAVVTVCFALLVGAAPARPEEAAVPKISKANPSIPEFFNGVNKDTMDRLDAFYAPDVLFRDPVSEIRGVAGIRAYYSRMYENLISIRFDFEKEVGQGDEVVAPWVMHMRHKAIAGGKEIVVPGVSHIRFANGKAVYHRDYFDMGAFVYEHVPVIGAGVRYVKKKVAGH
jgi:ketosteroid isomerase-like protein